MSRLATSGLFWVFAGFLLSRLLFFLLGVRFDGRSLDWSWQLLDPALLRADLARSLWNLHCAPPLFNAMVGCALKLFPSNPIVLLHAEFIAWGLILAGSMFSLLKRLSVSEQLAAIVTIVSVVSPAAVLFENDLSYTWPVSALLCLSGLLLHRFVTDGRILDGCGFFLTAACVTLTMAFFHLAWLLAIVVIALAWGRLGRGKVLATALVPTLLVAGWYVKNGVLFGSYSASSWLGMNFAKVAAFSLSKQERRQAVAAGVVSPLVLKFPFLPITAYVPASQLTSGVGHPAVNQVFKSNGEPNLNHRLYVGVANQYLHDAVRLVSRRPLVYCKGTALATLLFLRPSDNYWPLASNHERLGLYARGFDLVVSGAFLTPLLWEGERVTDEWRAGDSWFRFLSRVAARAGMFIAVAVVLSLVYGGRVALALRRRSPSAAAAATTLAFLWLTVAYTLVIGNLFELGENFRFRFMVDPFIWILLSAVYGGELRHLRHGAAPPATGPTTPPMP